jgi:hypothetical protein
MENLDLKKTLKYLYAPSAQEVSVVSVPPMNYLMVDGEGNPNTVPNYAQAVAALYSLSYTLRAMSKAANQVFTVMPLEGLWAFKGTQKEPFDITESDKDHFIWTMMILQPTHITAAMFSEALGNVRKKDTNALLNAVRFECYDEGEAVQIKHLGPYSAEAPTVAKLHSTIAENGWQLRGKHHEIYLSDPRKVAPEKMKTIIRQPFDRP